MTAVAEGAGGHWDAELRMLDGTMIAARAASTHGAAQAARRVLERVDWRWLAGRLAAAGSVHRLRLMGKLLEGPATYRALQRLTALKAGPLYHHINALRLAGLLAPKERDLYELTRAGRNLILILASAATLVSDVRRRPMHTAPPSAKRRRAARTRPTRRFGGARALPSG